MFVGFLLFMQNYVNYSVVKNEAVFYNLALVGYATICKFSIRLLYLLDMYVKSPFLPKLTSNIRTKAVDGLKLLIIPSAFSIDSWMKIGIFFFCIYFISLSASADFVGVVKKWNYVF